MASLARHEHRCSSACIGSNCGSPQNRTTGFYPKPPASANKNRRASWAAVWVLGHSEGHHPEPGAVQPGEGSRVGLPGTHYRYARDPSLRLKNGSGQDDAMESTDSKVKTHHYQKAADGRRSIRRILRRYECCSLQGHATRSAVGSEITKVLSGVMYAEEVRVWEHPNSRIAIFTSWAEPTPAPRLLRSSACHQESTARGALTEPPGRRCARQVCHR